MKRPQACPSSFVLQMRRFWLAFGFTVVAWSATDDWREVLSRVRENIARQIEKSTNYTCVETVDRTSFRSSLDLLPGCAYEAKTPDRVKNMHDRLRLDVAVSEGKEIFSWYGQNKFSGSSTIDDVVRRGAVSSGEFIGFLENIFVHGGIRFEYDGRGVVDGVTTYLFNYVVPLSSSGYHVGTRHGKPAVPFHGSFSVRGSDFQLVNLSVVADKIPENSLICSAETEMTYQIAKISGQDALLPSLFVLKLDDVNHRFTVSRSSYSQCHAFVAESTLQFDTRDAAASEVAHQPAIQEQLPAGTLLHIALKTPIDNEASYTGDPVEGILLHSVRTKDGAIIPKNSIVSGVITLFEDFDQPKHYYLLSIQFERLTFGRRVFLFRAGPAVSKLEGRKLTEIYGGPWPAEIQDAYNDGVFVFRSPRVHLDQRFADNWISQAVASAPSTSSTLSAR
ncbi:MAG TPA: hypothetical protein VMF91_11430 [Bryobacteraceae bacterium]|nr:hypothetical protein [Bryobacteraceae bacterium]